MRDLYKALRTLALADSDISALVEDRVYVNKIPRERVERSDTRQPPKMLVLRQGGGGAKADRLPIVNSTVIAVCYGETDLDANAVRRAVTQRFDLLTREVHDSVLIHHINPTGGPIPSVEADLVWPIVAQSFTVLADLME